MEGRITTKAPWGEHVELTCRNHQTLRWTTKNIGCIGARNIFFTGENSRGDRTKMSTEGILPSRQAALKMLAKGQLMDRADTTGETMLVDNETNRKMVNERYDKLEEQFVFECACDMGDLILDPKYAELPDVDE